MCAVAQERQRILVIDDNADIRELVAFVLQKENYEVTTAPDGVSGLRLIKENKPDLILLDVMMPDFSGFEVLEAVRKDKDSKVQAIPVLMITSKSATVDIDQALELGANSYIVKPFRPTNLVQKVNALLGNE
ncbi:MAG TPA: response regulator [Candidatus Nanopelagicaceae bacterium]